MILGSVTSNREAILPVVIRGLDGREIRVEAGIDTGYNGFLPLPRKLIEEPMKAVQVMFDEELLERLDSDREVQAEGRSAISRRAAAAYLESRRRAPSSRPTSAVRSWC